MQTAKKRFFHRVEINSKDECWPWIGGKLRGGYGSAKYKGRSIQAHRLCWILHFGGIPDGLLVLHDCDNKGCVNPGHLHLGTHRDNSRESIERGMQVPFVGSQNGMSKLVEADVERIRESYLFGGRAIDIAQIYGLTKGAVYHILQGRTWTHV